MLIEKVDLIRDLGVLLDCKLTFTQHIENCCNKALKLLGFIKRNTRDFTIIDGSPYSLSKITIRKL